MQHESFSITNATATTKFTLNQGGMYALSVKVGSSGTLVLEGLLADNTTYLQVGSGTSLTASGFVTGLNLPPGQYEFAIPAGTITAAALVRCPQG